MMSGPEPIWVKVCELSDIPLRGSRVLKTEAGCVALFRTVSDDVYALKDQCPHKKGPLSQGIVHDRSIACPLHNMVFDLDTGAARGPDDYEVQTFPTKIEHGIISVDLRNLGEGR
ncbi:MAG: nitrite reductase small subunit NirD [Pseudomonadota bacterium]